MALTYGQVAPSSSDSATLKLARSVLESLRPSATRPLRSLTMSSEEPGFRSFDKRWRPQLLPKFRLTACQDRRGHMPVRMSANTLPGGRWYTRGGGARRGGGKKGGAPPGGPPPPGRLRGGGNPPKKKKGGKPPPQNTPPPRQR